MLETSSVSSFHIAHFRFKAEPLGGGIPPATKAALFI